MNHAIWIYEWLKRRGFLLFLILAGFLFSACNADSGAMTPTSDIILPVTLSVGTPGYETQLQASPQATDTLFTDNATETQDPISSTGEVNSSGLRVVYASAGNLWLWETGSLLQLTDGGLDYSPIISSDGERIAFLRQVDRIHHREQTHQSYIPQSHKPSPYSNPNKFPALLPYYIAPEFPQ